MNKTEIEMAELKKQIEVMEAHLAGMPIQWGTGGGLVRPSRRASLMGLGLCQLSRQARGETENVVD